MKKVFAICLLTVFGLSFQTERKTCFFLPGESTMADTPRTDLTERGWGPLYPEILNKEVGLARRTANGNIGAYVQAQSETGNWGRRMAHRAMDLWPDSISNRTDRPVRWSYEQGVLLSGMEGQWLNSGDPLYFQYIRHIMDHFVEDDGNIRTYNEEEYNIDNINNGRMLLLLYQVTGNKKYFQAAGRLREQLLQQPRTRQGGFWHKKVYPWQMWLDGLYMAEPFYAAYAAMAQEDSAWGDIAHQFRLMEELARDPQTGLLYHGYDESRAERWADKKTGQSANFWARAMGWYGMALVDVLDYFPKNHPEYKALQQVLERYAKAVAACQDKSTGLWWDVLQYPAREGNYLEASASCMFVYSLAHAVRKGWLREKFGVLAQKAFASICKQFVRLNGDGQPNLMGTVAASGLGGKPYRDGSYNYYISEPVVENDPKGMGAFILAAAEMDMLNTGLPGRQKQVLLDHYFNGEMRRNAANVEEPFHYTWNDRQNSGFSLLGHLFRYFGATTETLFAAPSKENLRNASVYIIVDPDTRKESPDPKFIGQPDINVIGQWVKAGGVLLLMANDSANVELEHFNGLSETFGIHWSDSSANRVKNDQYEMGAVYIDTDNPVFQGLQKVYLKEICLLNITDPAKALLANGGHVVAALAAFGKGWVVAVGDPWIYNEYLDGRKLPLEYENYPAAKALALWLIEKAKKK